MFVGILEFLLVQVVKSSQKENDFQIMKYAQMEENIALHKNLYPISQISNMERSIKNTKNELFLMQSSAQLFYFKQLQNFYQLSYFKEWFHNHALTSPIPLQFFAVTYNDGIYFWEYEEISEEYNHLQMISYAQSGWHKRGEMNEEGIYVSAGYHSNNVKIYDMKYYNYPENKIQLLDSFSHTTFVLECFFKNSVSAICCDSAGYIKEYDLSNPNSIPTPQVFNKTSLSTLNSCMQTKDKKQIIAGGENKLYILDAEDGTLQNTLHYSANGGVAAYQIAEVRENILITADYETASLHDSQNLGPSLKLTDIGDYQTVIALESNLGDFAIGGRNSIPPYLGFVYIKHLEEDNQTITNLKYVDNMQGINCDISVIKELKRGTIIFGGNINCEEMCLWNYAAIPSQLPLCWDDQTSSHIYDIVGVPY